MKPPNHGPKSEAESFANQRCDHCGLPNRLCAARAAASAKAFEDLRQDALLLSDIRYHPELWFPYAFEKGFIAGLSCTDEGAAA